MRRLSGYGLECAVSGAGPVVVAFSANWCLSSLKLAAALRQIGEALGADRVTVGVVEVDEDLSGMTRSYRSDTLLSNCPCPGSLLAR